MKGGADNATASIPYVELILDSLRAGDERLTAAFGGHLHWGLWNGLEAPDVSVDGYASAAEQMSRHVIEAVGVAPGMRVLDVGCGLGGTVALLDRMHTDLSVAGLDVNERELAWAREHVEDQSRNSIEFVHGDALRTPFAADSFDVVLAIESIFHFGDRGAFLDEARRVLCQDGRLSVTDFTLGPRALLSLPTLPLHGARIARFYGRTERPLRRRAYERLARRAGFATDRAEDMTSRTMPTFDAMRELAEPPSPWPDEATAAIASLEALFRRRALLYELLVFSFES